MKWYVIYSTDKGFRVLSKIFSESSKAWRTAEKLRRDTARDFKLYTVSPGFDTEEEMNEYIKGRLEHSSAFMCSCLPCDRQWRVSVRNRDYSDRKPGGSYSEFSTIICLTCGASGRSAEKFVDNVQLVHPIELEAWVLKRKKRVEK